MNRKLMTSIALTSLVVGGALAAITGERRAVSLEVWLAGFGSWFAIAAMMALFTGLPLAPAPLAGVFFRGPRPGASRDTRPRELRHLESLILRSRDNDRAFAQQLQPRLTALAMHYLPVHHGIDVSSEPERIAKVLGDSAWLIDPHVSGRPPTLDEIDRFINLLTEDPR